MLLTPDLIPDLITLVYLMKSQKYNYKAPHYVLFSSLPLLPLS